MKAPYILFIIWFAWLPLTTGAADTGIAKKIIDSSLAVMPPLFASVLADHRRDIVDGFRDTERSLQYRIPAQGASGERVRVFIDRLARELTESIGKRPNFRRIAYTYGQIAAAFYRMYDPCAYLPADSPALALLQREYSKLQLAQLRKFKFFFYGYYCREQHLSIERRRQMAKLLQAAFLHNGKVRSHRYFSYRSIPFGLAQIHLNSAFSMTVCTWFSIWEQAKGYTQDSPYYQRKPAQPGRFLAIVE